MFKLPDLPYAYDALVPTVSETTMRTHHDKHHAKYVDTVNELLAKSGEQPRSMEDLVREAVAKGETKMANNAGQAWNHAFFWNAMTPGGGAPAGDLVQAIEQAFGGLDAFKTKFVEEGVGHFGSGWVWLIAREGKVAIKTTHDGETPLVEAQDTPLLVCDLWEHAYYLDYKNDRGGFLKAWFDKAANWRFAGEQFAAAKGSGEAYRYPAPVAKAA